MKLSKDLRDLDFKRNHEHRTQLLTKIESFGQMESVMGVSVCSTSTAWNGRSSVRLRLRPSSPCVPKLPRAHRRRLQRIRDFYQSRQKEEQAHLENQESPVEAKASGRDVSTTRRPGRR